MVEAADEEAAIKTAIKEYRIDRPDDQRRLAARPKVIKTEVVHVRDDEWGVAFTFDDGGDDFAVAGMKRAAEMYAREQKGETLPVGVHPLLLNAAKADELRKK